MMKNFIPLLIKSFSKKILAYLDFDPWVSRSWSQEGEDQILRRIFEKQSDGFYVDVGAHHPKRFSNTYLFYKQGWCGINIDAMPGSMSIFNRVRPRDINLEIGIGMNECKLNYYIFNETALNGFSKKISQERDDANSNYHLEDVIKVSLQPLNKVFERYMLPSQSIDFMSVDVEGLDFEVLKSNDWNRYRPKFVLAEILDSSLHEVERSDIGQLMTDVGYVIYAKCVNTVFFKAADQK